MKVRGQFHCLHCGYVPAKVEGEVDQPFDQAKLISASHGPGLTLDPHHSPRCGRCGGPVYLDELEVIRYEPVDATEIRRRLRPGRPRKASSAA